MAACKFWVYPMQRGTTFIAFSLEISSILVEIESISGCCLASTIALRLGYLRVGERGWIFDVGIAGPWAWDQDAHKPSQATVSDSLQ